MCSGLGWDCYKKAQTWFVALVRCLRLTAEPGMYCLLQAYSLWFCYFVQRQYYLAMFDLLQSRWKVAD
jgi:hypothetical protein